MDKLLCHWCHEKQYGEDRRASAHDAPRQYDYMDLFYIMEQLTTLRPNFVQSLLETAEHYKMKRLFLYMAEKAGHYWYEELDLTKIELGTHKLQLVKSGVYISKYKMVVPKELNDYE